MSIVYNISLQNQNNTQMVNFTHVPMGNVCYLRCQSINLAIWVYQTRELFERIVIICSRRWSIIPGGGGDTSSESPLV